MSGRGFDTRLRQKMLDAKFDDRVDHGDFRKRSHQLQFATFMYFARHHSTEYQLYRGETPWPKKQVMRVFDAFQLNREYERKWMAALDAGKDGPLYKWQVVDAAAYRSAFAKSKATYFEKRRKAEMDGEDTARG